MRVLVCRERSGERGPGSPALSSSSPLPGVSGSKLDMEPEQRSPLVEVKGNTELKGPLARPLPGRLSWDAGRRGGLTRWRRH